MKSLENRKSQNLPIISWRHIHWNHLNHLYWRHIIVGKFGHIRFFYGRKLKFWPSPWWFEFSFSKFRNLKFRSVYYLQSTRSRQQSSLCCLSFFHCRCPLSTPLPCQCQCQFNIYIRTTDDNISSISPSSEAHPCPSFLAPPLTTHMTKLRIQQNCVCSFLPFSCWFLPPFPPSLPSWNLNSSLPLRVCPGHFALTPTTTRKMSLADCEPSLQRTFRGHTRAINALSFNPNMTQLVSASNDNCVMLWHFRPQLRAYVLYKSTWTLNLIWCEQEFSTPCARRDGSCCLQLS